MVWLFNQSTSQIKAARDAGTVDGKDGIPDLNDADVSHYERELVDRCEQAISKLEGEFKEAEGELRQHFEIALIDYRRCKKEFEEKHSKLNRPVTKHIPMWGYVLSLLAIIIVELPINQAALNVLGEAPILTFSLASILGVVLMIAAHLIGMTLRHKGFHAGSIFAIFIIVCIIVGLAYVRVKFFMNPEEGEILSNAMKDMDTRVLAALFGVMNVLFLLVASWLSYLSHDEDEHYAQMKKNYLKNRAAALKIAQKRAKKHAAIETEAKEIIEMTHGQINEYRRYNLASRQSHIAPQAWREFAPEKLLDIERYNLQLKDNEVG